MVNLINYKNIRTKIILIFIIAIIFCQVSITQVIADEVKDGPLEINSGDWIEIELGTSTTLFWQLQVNTNERAIYWEIIIGNSVYKNGWGPNANCTTTILDEEDSSYEYVCHGYYAKYHVWSRMIVTCKDGGGNDGFDPKIILYIGIPIILVVGIALIVIIHSKSKKKQDFF